VRSSLRLARVAVARQVIERQVLKASGTSTYWRARWAERRTDETRLQLTVLRALRELSRSVGPSSSMALLGRKAWEGANDKEQAAKRIKLVLDGRLSKKISALAEAAAEPIRDTVDHALDSAAATHGLPVQKQSFSSIRDMHNLLREENFNMVAQQLEQSFAGYSGDLANIIVDAADPANPMTMAELSSKLENEFLNIDRKRAMMIARTESARVYGNTTYEFYQNAGFKEYRWATAAGSPSAVVSPVCTYCQGLAAAGMQQISSGFKAEAMIGVTHPRREQFGAKFPPYHPNCRCDIIANTKGWLPPAWMVNVPQQLTPTGPGMMQAVVQGGRAAQRQVVMQEIQKLRYGNLVKHVGFNNELGARTIGDSFTIPKTWGSNVPITQAQIENVVRHETGHVVWNSVLTKEQESEWIKVADELGFGPESRLAGERMRYLREGMAKGWSDDKFAGEFFAEAHNWYEAGGADRAFLKEAFPKQFREMELLISPKVEVAPVVSELRFASEEDAHAWASKSFKDWHSSEWSSDEQDFLRLYRGPGYEDVNASLRSGRGIEAAAIRDLDSAIAKQTLSDDVVAYRGLGKNIVLNVGDTFVDPAYLSTSLARTGAERFVTTDGALLELHVPSGTDAIYLNAGRVEAGKEVELLLPRGMSWRVTVARTEKLAGNTVRVYVLEPVAKVPELLDVLQLKPMQQSVLSFLPKFDLPADTEVRSISTAIRDWTNASTAVDTKEAARRLLEKPELWTSNMKAPLFTGMTQDAKAYQSAARLIEKLRTSSTEFSSLYRGESFSREKFREMLAAYRPGSVVDIELSSFTTREGTAKGFAETTKARNSAKFNRVVVELRGAPGVSMSGASAFPEENEVITTGRIRIVSVTPSSTYTRIVAEWEPSLVTQQLKPIVEKLPEVLRTPKDLQVWAQKLAESGPTIGGPSSDAYAGYSKAAELNGFDAAPQLVSQSTFNDMSGELVYRGVAKPEYTEAFKTGDLYSTGRGMFGSGTYFSDSAQMSGGYTGSRGEVFAAKLKDGAEVVQYEDLITEMRAFQVGHSVEINAIEDKLYEGISVAGKAGDLKLAEQLNSELRYLQSIMQDEGLYATLRGIDALVVPSGGARVMLVLNRGSMVMVE
jgi:hypothetical protein